MRIGRQRFKMIDAAEAKLIANKLSLWSARFRTLALMPAQSACLQRIDPTDAILAWQSRHLFV